MPAKLCPNCGRLIPKAHLANHVKGPKCSADTIAQRLLADLWRPYPTSHSLPDFIPTQEHVTRVPFEGEPRTINTAQSQPGTQVWAPLWVDLVVTEWAGRISNNECELDRRNRFLFWLLGRPELQRSLETVFMLSTEEVRRGTGHAIRNVSKYLFELELHFRDVDPARYHKAGVPSGGRPTHG